MFNSYFPELARFSGSIEAFQDHRESGWADFQTTSYFDSIDPDRKVRPEDILKKWTAVPEGLRYEFKPLLEEILSLSEKYKVKASEIDSTVSRSKYVMD